MRSLSSTVCLAHHGRVRQVGFIDFGIVGRVSPLTWAAVSGLADGLAAGDYRRMAAALVRPGPALVLDTAALLRFGPALVVDTAALVRPGPARPAWHQARRHCGSSCVPDAG